MEAPIHHSLVGQSVPQLDPALDSLIDCVLCEDEDALQEDSWLLDEAAAYMTPSRVQSEDEAPGEEYVGQESLEPGMPASSMPPTLLSGNVSPPDSNLIRTMCPLNVFESLLPEASQNSPGLQPDDWLSGDNADILEEALGPIVCVCC